MLLPQMSPMWWLTLMLTFNIILIMTNTTIYFEKKTKMTKKNNLKKKIMNWKW